MTLQDRRICQNRNFLKFFVPFIKEVEFPKDEPYGWKNYPFDYWNIWVNHAGNEPFESEPTLEILTKEYDLIIFKHCYPVCQIKDQISTPSVTSEEKTLENYKLQYNELKIKMHEFPDTKFLILTGAAKVKSSISEEEAKHGREFFDWVRNVWDEKGDNIFLWDLYEFQTEGGIFFKDKYAESSGDSHPNKEFCKKVYSAFCNRIVSVIEGNGDATSISGI